MSEDTAQINTMKSFERTLNKFPRHSQPQPLEEHVFSELEGVRRKDEAFRSQHLVQRKDLTGSSWNSLHLDGFIREKGSGAISNRSKQKPDRPLNTDRPEHYFRTTKDNQNSSRYGYTDVNPLASYPKVQPQGLDRFLSEVLHRKNPVLHENNRPVPVRERHTDPITFKDVPIPQYQHLGAKKIRLLNLIEKQYPHGIMGIDSPDVAMRFYKEAPNYRQRVRAQPTSQLDYEIDRDWKTKRRVPSPKPTIVHRTRECVRRLSNGSAYDYNIVSNTQR